MKNLGEMFGRKVTTKDIKELLIELEKKVSNNEDYATLLLLVFQYQVIAKDLLEIVEQEVTSPFSDDLGTSEVLSRM